MSAYGLQAPWPALAPALAGGVARAGLGSMVVGPSQRPSQPQVCSLPLGASFCELQRWRPRSRHRSCRFSSFVALGVGSALSLLFFPGQRKRCSFFLIRPLPLFSFFFRLLSYSFSRVPGLSASTSPSPCKQISFPPLFKSFDLCCFPI